MRATSRAPTRSAHDLEARGIILEDQRHGHALEAEVGNRESTAMSSA